jgi:hypothetical protein
MPTLPRPLKQLGVSEMTPFLSNLNKTPTRCTYILKTHEIDKQNVLYHLLHNVTDRHLKPFAQDVMKVSLAAQAMSSSVAAAIDTAGKEMCF